MNRADLRVFIGVGLLVLIAGCAPGYDATLEACNGLIDENPNLNIDKNSARDFGTNDGNRIIVYDAMLLGNKVQRICVSDGSRVQFPSVLTQSQYLN